MCVCVCVCVSVCVCARLSTMMSCILAPVARCFWITSFNMMISVSFTVKSSSVLQRTTNSGTPRTMHTAPCDGGTPSYFTTG